MKLVIVGNGFDCAHGLKTNYWSFRNYIKKHDAVEYEFLKQLFGDKFETDEFWYNFEESLVRYNLKNFVCNLEKENSFNRKNGFDDEDCEQANKEYFNDGFYKLKRYFCAWIKTINDTNMRDVKRKECVSAYLEDSIILTFNYTSTIESIYDKDCYHIHGKIDNANIENDIGIEDIILGHPFDISFTTDDGKNISAEDVVAVTDNGEEIPFDSISPVKNFDVSNVDSINNSLSEADYNFENIFTKRCQKIIKEDTTGFFESLKNNANSIDEIVILGHSLSNVDKPYFIKMLDILKDNGKSINWIVSYYKNNKSTLENNLKMIDSNSNPSFININND